MFYDVDRADLVSFRSSSDMKKVVSRMDGFEIHGRKINVRVMKALKLQALYFLPLGQVGS